MAIPKISAYSMPSLSGLPANRAGWTPDRNRAVLLIHDMQNYFVQAYTEGASPVTELIINIRKLKACCEQLGIPVFFSAQPGNQPAEERGLLRDFWGPGMGDEPEHTAIVAGLAPASEEGMIVKWRYSAFQKTDLLQKMERLGRDQLIICGIYAHIGCLMTACEAFMRDIECFMAGDGVADFSLEQHEMALRYAAERCAVVDSVDGLTAKLAASSAEPQTANLGAAEQSGDNGRLSKAQVHQQIADILERPAADIGEHDDLVEWWGMDSIRIMSLAEQWRNEGAEIGFMELAEVPTLEAWWKLLCKRSGTERPNIDYFFV